MSENETQSKTNHSKEQDDIIRTHVLWSMGAGLIPVPLIDIAAVTGIQMDAIQQLAKLQDVDISEDQGKRFVLALAGGTVARLGASMTKAIPVIGTLFGGVSMSILSGASTYAICHVALKQFEEGDCLEDGIGKAKSLYEEALEKGRAFAESLKGEEDVGKDAYSDLLKLKELHGKGILTDEEYSSKKESILARL